MKLQSRNPSKGLTLIGILSLIWLAILASHYLDLGRSATARPPSSDFYKFYLSAQRVDAGLSMYWMVPPRLKKGDPCHPDTPEGEAKLDHTPSRLNLGGNLPCLGPNLNPPIFTALLLPLSRLTYEQAWWIWGSFSIICAAGFAVVAAFELGQNRRQRLLYAPISCALVFSFYPTLANFSLGQLGSVIALLLVLSWRCARNRHDTQAAIWLGVALAIKPIFGVLWLGLLVVQRWRLAAWSALCALTLTAMGAALFGLHAYQDYAQVASNVHWTATNWNASWFGLFDRAYSGQANSNWMADRTWSKALGFAASGITLGVSAWILNRQDACDPGVRLNAVFAVGLPATMLTAPLGWMYYFPVFLITLLILLQALRSSDRRHHGLYLVLIAIMTMIPIGLKPAPSPDNPTTWYSLDSWYWLCAISLWAITLASLTKAPEMRKGA